MSGLTGFGLASIKSEGAIVPYDDAVPSGAAAEIETWLEMLHAAVLQTEGDAQIVSMTGNVSAVADAYKGTPFCWAAWTKSRVYFPEAYDGSLAVRSAPRNPCDEGVHCVGGGSGADS